MADAYGGFVFGHTIISDSCEVSHDFWGQGTKTAFGNLSITVFAWRENKFNDKTLHWCIYSSSRSPLNIGYGKLLVGSRDSMLSENYYLRAMSMQLSINGTYIVNGKPTWSDGSYKMPYFAAKTLVTGNASGNVATPAGALTEENKDRLPNGETSWRLLEKEFTSRLYFGFQVSDHGINFQDVQNWTANKTRQNMTFKYPPYMPVPSKNTDSFPSTPSNGSMDISDGSTKLTNWWAYKITKASNNKNVFNWNPSTSTGEYGLGITTDVIINGNTYNGTGSSSKDYTHSTIASSYSGYVKRYYTDMTGIYTISSSSTAYTYSKPSLSGIALSKSTLSPRSGSGLRVTLNGMNNRTWGVENNYDTKIWSNCNGSSGSPYTNDRTTSNYKDYGQGDIRALFPDTSASNGVVNGTIYTLRRNMGVKGGNPGNGTQIYATGVKQANVKIQYTPKEKINVDDEPNGNDNHSGLAYYKCENGVQGNKIAAATTWELLNNYDISNMTGIRVNVQYPKTDGSGVISGYRVRLYSAVDGSPKSDTMYYENHFNTSDYNFTFTIFYSELRRGVSGNIIKITPYYIASNGAKWYGPEVSKRFVDIAWRLNKPVIDCPLNDTTWHNHKYRILFRLPIDKDTQYNGNTNDIENYYGSGNYRYQNICIKINGIDTYFDDKTFYNAHNAWNSPISISNANLTYRRTIIVNPSLLPNYKDEASYSIQIRVRKAYGQNSNCDGWSDWSDTIFVRRKTVSNDVVKRHEYIMASHYKTVQDAFNNSLACYSKTASDNKNFVIKESFDRVRGDNINGPHLSPPTNTPLRTIREYVSEFNDLHQLKNKINSYASFDTDQDRSLVKLDSKNNLLANFTPSQEFITAAKDQNGATECDNINTILKGRNYMKYMCDELNHLY